MFNVALIEDDSVHRDFFSSQIQEQIKSISYDFNAYEDPGDFLKNGKHIESLDLLVMDLNFKDWDTLEFLKQFQKEHPRVDIIFLSAFLEFAPKVYEVDHIAFIYKRDLDKYLETAIQKALANKEKRENRSLKLRWKNTYYIVPAVDILFIEKVLRKTSVHTMDKEYSTYTKMEEILEQLDDNFIRVHFSYAVNKKYIQEFHSSEVVMADGSVIPVSRTYSKTLMEYVQQLFDEGLDENQNNPPFPEDLLEPEVFDEDGQIKLFSPPTDDPNG